MAAKTNFHFVKTVNSHVYQNLKNAFPKEFFNKIWLKVGEHEYIYIFDMEFETHYSV